MIKEKLRHALARHPDRPFIVSPSGQWTYAGFYQYTCQVAEVLDQLPAGRLACHLPDSPQLVAVMFAAALRRRSLVLFNHDYSAQQIVPLLDFIQPSALITDQALTHAACKVVGPEILNTETADGQVLLADGADGDSEILILTSGTTGQPKCAQYNWARLFAQVAGSSDSAEERWLLAYRLNHFAGVQMLVHVLSKCSTLVLPVSSKVGDAVKAMSEFKVTHVSSTPTFWRYALTLLQNQRDQINLQHITLGSEATPGDLLEKLHSLFPEARIVQIYASTEAGSCISVSDMKPGLPVSVLTRPTDAAVQFRIVDGELEVKTANGMNGYLGGNAEEKVARNQFQPSGDLVRIKGDRIMFVGRKNETINVGGVKVHPLDVENIISPVAGVKLVKVYGQANPIVGQIVAVDVVCEDDQDPEAIEASIRQACETLPRHSRPRSINFVDTMLTNNNKLSRRT